jgi:hypothetical protein
LTHVNILPELYDDGREIAKSWVGMPGSTDETSGGRARSEIALCIEKRRLLEAFTEAVHGVMLLQQQQVTDIVNDDDFSRFDVLLHVANEKKDQAKYTYLQHVEKHGC